MDTIAARVRVLNAELRNDTEGSRRAISVERQIMIGLGGLGTSLVSSLWEMLWARRSLDEDIRSSKPQQRQN